MPSAVFVLGSVLILTTSGNKGSGFLAPVTPSMAELGRGRNPREAAPVPSYAEVVAVAVLALTPPGLPMYAVLADRRYVDLPP